MLCHSLVESELSLVQSVFVSCYVELPSQSLSSLVESESKSVSCEYIVASSESFCFCFSINVSMFRIGVTVSVVRHSHRKCCCH